jgi:hypothetical protein
LAIVMAIPEHWYVAEGRVRDQWYPISAMHRTVGEAAASGVFYAEMNRAIPIDAIRLVQVALEHGAVAVVAEWRRVAPTLASEEEFHAN